MTLLMLFTIFTSAAFLWRFAGLILKIEHTSAFWERFLRYVPISIFTALVISSLYVAPELLPLKIVALVVAAVVMWRTRQFGLGVVVGWSTLLILNMALSK